MRTVIRLAAVGCVVFWSCAGHPIEARAQTELDRIVSRVNDRIITQSDVRQARLLKLVDDVSSDESTRRDLENRILILAEIARLPPLPPSTEQDFSSRRAEWESRMGDTARIAELVSQTALGPQGLAMWLRDDVRIRMHLQRQFGALPESERARATADWIARLRQRAGL